MDLLKCLGAPGFTAYGICAALFIFAYVLYRLFLALFRRIFRGEGLWQTLVEAFRFPVLVIFFEIAAISSLYILGIKKQYEALYSHTLTIMVIATVGWLIASLVHALYHRFYDQYERSIEADEHYRGLITQALFVYRLVMFVIFSVTVATILMTFPQIRNIGIGILSSAGIAGIALGMAARPILLNFMAGFQIAMTKVIKIGDGVHIENEFARIEAIHLTHVVARTWDLRRLILPISYFIDKPFQNWDVKDPELLGSIFIHLDYRAPFDVIRSQVEALVKGNPNWNGNVCKMHVTNSNHQTVEVRLIMSAKDAPTAFELKSFVREKLVEFLQKEHPEALPCVRYFS